MCDCILILRAEGGEQLPVSNIDWAASKRLIPSKYPPIDLFEDIAPPEDWELLAVAESKTNPRVFDEIGDLSRLPVDRRVAGPGASWAIAPFTHVSSDRPTRFSDGSFGIYYCSRNFETAVAETAFHQGRFLAGTAEDPGWVLTMRELTADVANDFEDIRKGDFVDYLHPSEYAHAQAFSTKVRAAGANGIIYPSVRHTGGECLAAFWPDVIGLPVQADHWDYHWNGERIDMIRKSDTAGRGTSKVMRLD